MEVIMKPKIYISLLRGINVVGKELAMSHYRGNIIETFVFDELLKANTSAVNKAGLFYYGTTDRKEIDFILEFGENMFSVPLGFLG